MLYVSEKALKQLEELEERDREAIKAKLKELAEAFEAGFLPRVDLRKLRGRLEGYYRLRVGKFRVILSLRWEDGSVFVYEIQRRRSAYR